MSLEQVLNLISGRPTSIEMASVTLCGETRDFRRRELVELGNLLSHLQDAEKIAATRNSLQIRRGRNIGKIVIWNAEHKLEVVIYDTNPRSPVIRLQIPDHRHVSSIRVELFDQNNRLFSLVEHHGDVSKMPGSL